MTTPRTPRRRKATDPVSEPVGEEAVDSEERPDLIERDRAFDPSQFTAAPDGYDWIDSIQMDAVDWLWKPIIPIGAVTIVAGAGGCTKTSLMCDAAAKLSRGLLPGDFEDEAVKTLYLSKEDSPHTSLVPKMTIARAAKGHVMVLDGKKTVNMNLATDMGCEQLRSMVETHGFKLIVVDPSAAFFHTKFSQQTNYAASVQAMTPLAALAAELGIAVVCIMHLQKGKTKASVDSIVGSIGFSTTGRHVNLVGRVGREHRVIGVVKSNVAADGLGMVYRVEYVDRIEITRKSGVKKSLSTSKVTLVRPATPDEIENCLDSSMAFSPSDARVRETLQVLMEIGGPIDTTSLHERLKADGVVDINVRAFRDFMGTVAGSGLVIVAGGGHGVTRQYAISRAGSAYLRGRPFTDVGSVGPTTTTTVWDDPDEDDTPFA